MHEKMSNLSYALLQECYIIHILSTVFIFFFFVPKPSMILDRKKIFKKNNLISKKWWDSGPDESLIIRLLGT